MSFCLKAATSLEGADLDQLTASIEHYTRAGMPVGEAELAAVNDLLAQLYGERAEMTGLLREQHPDLFSTARASQSSPQAEEVATAAAGRAPSANRLFTEATADAARALLKRKLSQLSSGIDPEVLHAGLTLAAYHIERGARTFAAYSAAMLQDLGEVARPYLTRWYAIVSFDPGFASLRGEMTPLSELRLPQAEQQPGTALASPQEGAPAPAAHAAHAATSDQSIQGVVETDANGEAGNDELPMLDLADKYTPAELEALRKAGLSGPRTLRGRIRAYFSRVASALHSDLARQFQQGYLDQFTGIALAVRRELGNLPLEQDPYVAARLANGGTSSVMRGLLLHGQARWAANGQHLEKVPGTEGLLEILSPLGDDLNSFFGWMVGNRAARLRTEGREHNLSDDEIKVLQGLAIGKEALFRRTALAYAAFKRSVLDVAEEAGLIDPEGRKAWDHADYIPFYRGVDERSSLSPTGRRGLAGQSSGVRVLKGGAAALNDPLENILMNFSRLVDASLKNSAIAKTVSVLEEAGSDIVEKVGYDAVPASVPRQQLADQLTAAGTPPAVLDAIPDEAFTGMGKMLAIQAPTDPAVVRIMVDGKARFYRVNDPLLLKALTSFVPFDFPGLGVARAFKRVLTAAVTATPDFMVRNFVRDSLAVQLVGRNGFNPAKSLTGIAKSYREASGFEPMLFAGASFQSGNINANDPSGTAATMRRALRRKQLRAATASGALGLLIDTPARWWEHYRHVGEAIENANREAVYEATLRARGATAAAFEAKDIMDFTLRGSSPIYQVMADVFPFFNARVQGLYRLGRADPKRLATYGALMMVATLALAWANSDNDDYDELPDWSKDTYWHFWLNGVHLKIPKPFELGVVFGTVPERLMRYAMGQDTGKKAAAQVWKAIADQLQVLGPGTGPVPWLPLPQIVAPAVNAGVNYDPFRQAPIEGMADEGKLASLRYGPTTSRAVRAAVQAVAPAADTIGLSPKKLEYLVKGYLGTVGAYALGISDLAFRAIDGKAPPQPASRLDELPIIKSFYEQSPARGTVYESDLYALREEVSQVYRSIKALESEDRDDEADALREKHAGKLDVRRQLERAAKRLKRLNRERDEVYADMAMDPKAKRTRLDEILAEKAELAREVMKDPDVLEAR